jgi:hypothetical protein
VGDHVSGEWCSNKCHAAWVTAQPVPERNQDPYSRPDILPDPPPEPPWLAAITAAEKARAQRLIADRKSPEGEVAA